MKASTNTLPCARAEDLVSYLYGEATPGEAKDFENHMRRCASCRTELTAFGDVREAIGDWRVQALGHVTSPAFEAEASRLSARAAAPPQRRSALAALREFFTLSPVWMRAATGIAAVLFCALAAIAVAYFVQKPQTVVVERPVKSGYSDEEVERMVAEAIKKEKQSQVNETPVSAPEPVQTANIEQPKSRPQIERNSSAAPQVANKKRSRQSAPRNAVRPSTELASADYLPFTASGDDEKLPSLADLVDEANKE